MRFDPEFYATESSMPNPLNVHRICLCRPDRMWATADPKLTAPRWIVKPFGIGLVWAAWSCPRVSQHVIPASPDFKVQMRSRRIPGAAHFTNFLSLNYGFSWFNDN